MPRKLEMTPERAVKALALLRDACAAIERNELTLLGLYFIVSNAVNPITLTDDEIKEAEREIPAIMATDEWKQR